MNLFKYCNNSALIPTTLINLVLFLISAILLTSYGIHGFIWIPLLIALTCYLSQIVLFFKFDRNSFLICVPLSIYALLFGWVQEVLFIYFGIHFYPNSTLFPPFWILALYPLFALTLNSSLSSFNKNLYTTFILGGMGGCFSYILLEKLNGVHLLAPYAYFVLFIFWGVTLTLLIVLNRKLNFLREKYTNPNEIKRLLTVFFDKRCSFCSHEMQKLQNRNQTGEVCYACPSADEDLSKMTTAFTYKEAMETIHAIDEDNKVLTGTATISALFARTDLPWIAIFLQAPGFSYLFSFGYFFFAKLRRRK